MDYETEPAWIPRFGHVEKICVGSRWVGMVFRNPQLSGESAHLWVAYHRGGHAAESHEDAIRIVLEHAAMHPDFTLA
jgi:hypothetical protein